MTTYSYGDGRIWIQRKKFETFELLLPYGMTGITDPVGALTPVREPSASTRRRSVIVDILRGEPGLPEFQIETRLMKTLNLMFALKDCAVNFQCHLGACGRPDNYLASNMALHWQTAFRGDLAIDRLAKIEGDDAPDAVAVPWSAMLGPVLIDFEAEFLSQRTIAETEAILDMAFLESECFEDCKAQEDAGENGYAVTGVLAGSPTNVANVWYTVDKGESWAETSARPFIAGMDISSVVLLGTVNNHRIVVANGTTQAGAPAQIAYADVTEMGTTGWVTVNVGSHNGEYINKLLWLDYQHLYAVTDHGYVYLSDDGGATWSAVLTTAVNDLNDISGIPYGENSGVVWTVGDSNTIFMSADFGSTWTAVAGPAGGVGDNCTAVEVTPDGTVFVGNDAGELYGTYNDGDDWETLGVQGVTPTAVTSMCAWGDYQIWLAVDTASGGRVLRSVDGGASFHLWNLNIPTNSGINVIVEVDPNVVYVGGDPHGGTAFISKTNTVLLGV